MSKSVSFFAIAVAVCLAGATDGAPASNSAIPDFQSNNVSWIAINSDFTGVPGGPQPVGFDPGNQLGHHDIPLRRTPYRRIFDQIQGAGSQ